MKTKYINKEGADVVSFVVDDVIKYNAPALTHLTDTNKTSDFKEIFTHDGPMEELVGQTLAIIGEAACDNKYGVCKGKRFKKILLNNITDKKGQFLMTSQWFDIRKCRRGLKIREGNVLHFNTKVEKHVQAGITRYRLTNPTRIDRIVSGAAREEGVNG